MSFKRKCMTESPDEELARLRAENAALKAKRERWPFTPAGFVQPPLDDVCGKILPAAWARCHALVPHIFSGSVDRMSDDWKSGFYRAFAALATFRRADAPDRQSAVLWMGIWVLMSLNRESPEKDKAGRVATAC
jgi:hypothetical protein